MRLLGQFFRLSVVWFWGTAANAGSLTWEIWDRGKLVGYLWGTTHVAISTSAQEEIERFAYWSSVDRLYVEKVADSVAVRKATDEVNRKHLLSLGRCDGGDNECLRVETELREFDSDKPKGMRVSYSDLFRATHPYFLSLVIEALSGKTTSPTPSVGIEAVAIAYARSRGIEIKPLESLEVLISTTTSLSKNEGLALVERAVELVRQPSEIKKRENWLRGASEHIKRGDCLALLTRFNEVYAPSAALQAAYQKLYTSRNPGMAKTLETYIRGQSDKKLLAIVGAHHACGESSLVSELEKLGLRMTRLE